MKSMKSHHCLATADPDIDQKLYEMEIRLKQQQQILQRMYRKLEKDEVENRTKLHKFDEQRKLIRMMRQEKRDLAFLQKKSQNGTPYGQKEDLTATTTQAVHFMIDIYEEQVEFVEQVAESMIEIGNCVTYLIKLMNKYRLSIQRNFGTLKTGADYDRRQDILETRLQLIVNKFCTTIRECDTIKVDINNYLVDRSTFFRRVLSFKQQIANSKVLIHNTVVKANHSYDKYDDLRMQDRMIKRRNSIDCQIFVSDLKDTVRFLRNDRYLRDFIERKGRIRPFMEIESDRTRRKIKLSLDTMKRLIPEYRYALKLIADESGFPNVDYTMHVYLETEQNNFATFRYIINLQDIIYVLQEEIHNMKLEIYDAKDSRNNLRKGYRETIKSLRRENFDLNSERSYLRQQALLVEADVKNMVKQIDQIFKQAGADADALKKFLGNKKGGVGVVNLIPFLRILEARAAILIRRRESLKRAQAQLRGYKYNSGGGTSLLGSTGSHFKRKSLGGPFLPVITIPNTFETGENDDEDKEFTKRPLTHEEHRRICDELATQAYGFIKAFIRSESAASISIDEDAISNYSEPF